MYKSKTLIILSPGFAADETDSTCLPTHQVFVKALNRNYPQLSITILAFQYPFAGSSYQWFGNKVTSFRGRNSTRKIKMFLLWKNVWFVLRALKKENDVIALLSFWCTDCAMVGKYFGKINGIPHYSWVTGQDAKKSNRYIRLVRPKTNELVAMSDFLATEFYKNHGIRIEHVITNGIDASVFEKYDGVKDIDIMGAGSLVPLKQYDIFIDVCKSLIKHFEKLNIRLCGAGPEESRLRGMISEDKLENEIELTGERQHAWVLQMMQRTKIFLHTSMYEGFSTVCLEALYAGCHVISFVKPMEIDTPHWHIVLTKEAMITKARELLEASDTRYTSVLPYNMDDSIRRFMQLFGY